MRIFKITVFLFVILLTSGCSMGNNTKETAYEKINKKFIDIADYSSTGKIVMHSNKTSNEYEFTQYFKREDKYLLQYTNGISIIFNNNDVSIKNSELKSELNFESNSKEYIYFFVNSFFEKYFSGEDVSVSVDSAINEKYIVLECDTDGYRFKKQKLWIDIKTILPTKMEIYDENGFKAVSIFFDSFKFEKNIDETLFSVSSVSE